MQERRESKLVTHSNRLTRLKVKGRQTRASSEHCETSGNAGLGFLLQKFGPGPG